jgi:hypothetical protein
LPTSLGNKLARLERSGRAFCATLPQNSAAQALPLINKPGTRFSPEQLLPDLRQSHHSSLLSAINSHRI